MKKTPHLPGSAMPRASGIFSHPVGQRFNLKPLFCQMAILGCVSLFSTPVMADCSSDGTGNYTCSGTLNKTKEIAQDISATVAVKTSGIFNVEAPSGDALIIKNFLGPVTYTDTFKSSLTSLDTTTGFGLRVLTAGNSIIIDSNGAISGIKVDNTNNARSYGNILINVTGDINNRTTGSQADNDGMGISAIYSSSEDDQKIYIETNNVSAVNDGINILNNGLGLNVIHAKGNVSSDNKTGVYVRTTKENDKNGITITTDGTVKGGTSGITVDYAGLGNINITSNGTVNGEGFGGIHVDTAANSTANITVTTADVSGGGAGIRVDNQGVGNVTITSNGNITTKESITDKTKAGIAVTSSNGSAGEITINANGTIQSKETGISVDQSGTGKINIIAKQAITADLGDGVSVKNTTASSDITVNTAAVTGANKGIYVANDGLGATSITATDTITALSGVGIYAENADTSSKDITLSTADVISPQTGILALQAGTGAINITTGSVRGTEEAGVKAEMNNLLSTADITITTQGKVTGGFSGISAKHTGAGKINITANHIVEGGDEAIEVASNGQPINITINGTVRNLTQLPTDLAVNTVGGPTTLTNNNQLVGTVQFENSASKIINNGTWNTAGEAVQWFSNINGLTNTYQATLVNTGTINTQAGVTRFSGFATFTNAGTINISDKSAGDRVEIDGHYIGQGGTVILDTVLGDDQTTTDTLHLQNGSTGHTKLIVLKQGNGHATLTHEGIQLIEVTNGPSDAVFTLNNRVVAGPYEYELYQGSISNPQDGHWYLRSQDNDISNLIPGSIPKPKYRPEVGAYLGNQMAAQNMFMHSLSARIGEARNTAAYSSQGNPSTGWARITVNHSKNEALNGKLQEKTNMDVLQLGQDIVRWSRDGKDQWRIGIMGGAGHSKTSANVRNNSAKAYGKVNGYSAGMYGTWFTHAEQNQGLYVDTWLQQGWYRNEINGHDLPQESYRSRSLTASIELGYGVIVGQSASRQWIVEPQGQLTHIDYRSHEITEENGTRINKMSEHNILKRLGMRVSSRPADKVGGLQPFVEVNWLHGHHANTLSFGGTSVTNDVPESRFQLKAGVQGTLSKNWQVWGHMSGEKGKNNYKGYEGSIGLKHVW